MFTCAECTVHACYTEFTGDRSAMPKNCPMRNDAFFAQLMEEYHKPENHQFFLTSTAIEAIGYCQWPRLREVAEFARRMGYTRLGLGFCAGFTREAAIVSRLLRQQGFEVYSVICKTGGIPKGDVGVDPDNLPTADGDTVPSTPQQHRMMCSNMCNPIAQAQLLNRSNTQLNICLGLCVGHDSLFYKYCEAPVTTLVAKDRVTGHNPVAAIYCADSYFSNRNTIQPE